MSEPISPLVVIPCGKAKWHDRAPAGKFYIGQYHRSCRKAADALTASGGERAARRDSQPGVSGADASVRYPLTRRRPRTDTPHTRGGTGPPGRTRSETQPPTACGGRGRSG